MQIAFASKPAARATTVEFLTTSERSRLPAGIREAELSLQPNSRVLFHATDTLYVGLGAREKVTADVLRRAAGTAALTLRKAGRRDWNVRLHDWPEHSGAVVEGLLHGSYRFEDFKATKIASPERATVVVGAANLIQARAAGTRSELIGNVVNLVRRICNQPGNIVYPATLAEEAQWHSRKFGLRCTVVDEHKLRAKKFGGILAVGEGSARPPRLIML
jgi:leucyl aminopeptidase